MSDLPQDLQACHSMIQRLQQELAECRSKLAVHEQNQKREWERRYGRGATADSLLGFGQVMAAAMNQQSDSQRETIEAELAAEDAMRPRRSSRRKK